MLTYFSKKYYFLIFFYTLVSYFLDLLDRHNVQLFIYNLETWDRSSHQPKCILLLSHLKNKTVIILIMFTPCNCFISLLFTTKQLNKMHYFQHFLYRWFSLKPTAFKILPHYFNTVVLFKTSVNFKLLNPWVDSQATFIWPISKIGFLQ